MFPQPKFTIGLGFFGNFPHLVGTLTGVENCETIQKLHQVVCGNDCIIFFLKSRPIYVNVDLLYIWVSFSRTGKIAILCPDLTNRSSDGYPITQYSQEMGLQQHVCCALIVCDKDDCNDCVMPISWLVRWVTTARVPIILVCFLFKSAFTTQLLFRLTILTFDGVAF